MNKIIATVLFGVLVFAGLAFYFSAHRGEEVTHFARVTSTPPSDVSVPTSTPLLTTMTDGMLEYRNSAFRFSLAIPQGYPATEYKEAGNSFTVSFQDPNTNQGFEVYVTPYTGTQITEQRLKLDEPSGTYLQPTNVIVDGTRATMFFGKNDIMGDTREVWFIHGGYLYEVTTYKELDRWLADIMKTWKFI